jgi:DNA repair protein RAD5
VFSAPYIITPAAKQEAPADSDDLCESNPAVVFPTDDNIDQWMKQRDGPAGLGSSKLQKFVSLMRELRETSTPRDPLRIVVFANYKSTLRLAISALAADDSQYDQKHVFVHGGITSTYKREELYTRFRVSPHVEALFMPLKLGGVGLNLTEANRVILLEPWYAWSPIHQAICRVYRIGQMREVDIYQFMATDSAEERVCRIAQNKKDLAEDVAATQEKKLGVEDMEFILFDPAPDSDPAARSVATT